MQGDLLKGYEEQRWEVVEIKKQKHGSAELTIYVHTKPLNWSGPEQSEGLPWEE